MSDRLISQLIVTAGVVALATVFAVDAHLTRKARLKAMGILKTRLNRPTDTKSSEK